MEFETLCFILNIRWRKQNAFLFLFHFNCAGTVTETEKIPGETVTNRKRISTTEIGTNIASPHASR